MATTTNFGWTTPNDTDLVSQGAAAIRTLGSAIDTSMMDLKGGTTGQVLSKASNTDMDFTWVAQDDSNAIQNALLTTTGDTIYASAASTPARLGIGSTGQVLTVSGGLPVWATLSAGAYTSLATGSLSGVEVSITNLSQSYTDLLIYINNPFVNVANRLSFRCNNLSTSIYETSFLRSDSTTIGNTTASAQLEMANFSLPVSTSDHSYTLLIRNYASSFQHPVSGLISANNGVFTIGRVNMSSAITSIQIRNANGTSTFSGGTYTIYGVK